jgi:hypothetical protein
MLVKSTIADDFLASYKAVLTEVNGGKTPRDINEFAKCRKKLYSDSVSIADFTRIAEDFKKALRRAIYGRFIFLKKYKSWYAFQHLATNKYFAALGLTSPIETMVEDFSIIETALVPYRDLIVCDGLIVDENILLGKNLIRNCRDGYLQAKRLGDLIQKL